MLLRYRRNQSGEFAAGAWPIHVYLAAYVDQLWIILYDLISVIGFLFGFSLASSYAAYQLLDEYKQASAALQASVEELQRSTEKVCTIIFHSSHTR